MGVLALVNKALHPPTPGPRTNPCRDRRAHEASWLGRNTPCCGLPFFLGGDEGQDLLELSVGAGDSELSPCPQADLALTGFGQPLPFPRLSLIFCKMRRLN